MSDPETPDWARQLADAWEDQHPTQTRLISLATLLVVLVLGARRVASIQRKRTSREPSEKP